MQQADALSGHNPHLPPRGGTGHQQNPLTFVWLSQRSDSFLKEFSSPNHYICQITKQLAYALIAVNDQENN